MTKSFIGTSFYFSAAVPATNDAAGFEALTWGDKVPGYQGGARFGFEAEDIDVPDLESGITTKLKGMSTGAASTLTFHGPSSQTRAAALKAAADGVGSVGSIKIVRATTPGSPPVAGDPVQYAQGYLKSFMEAEQTATSHEGFTVSFQQNAPHVTDEEPT